MTKNLQSYPQAPAAIPSYPERFELTALIDEKEFVITAADAHAAAADLVVIMAEYDNDYEAAITALSPPAGNDRNDLMSFALLRAVENWLAAECGRIDADAHQEMTPSMVSTLNRIWAAEAPRHCYAHGWSSLMEDDLALMRAQCAEFLKGDEGRRMPQVL